MNILQSLLINLGLFLISWIIMFIIIIVGLCIASIDYLLVLSISLVLFFVYNYKIKNYDNYK